MARFKVTQRHQVLTTRQVNALVDKFRGFFGWLGLGYWKSQKDGIITVGTGSKTAMKAVSRNDGRWSVVTVNFAK